MPSLFVTEIYASIQGESTYVGVPCTFVRLTGCPLRCRWCDTAYAFKGGTERTLDEIVTEIERLGVPTVELTGGEPLAQAATPELIQELAKRGYKVLIETSGSESIHGLHPDLHIVMDIKCPGSGMDSHNRIDNLSALKSTDDLKFVISSRDDFLWATQFVRTHHLISRVHVMFSPAWGLLDPKQLVEWILEEKLPIRLNLQIHKYVWGPRAKGV
jgi:7-carboxy-7-deazaguanine synthase